MQLELHLVREVHSVGLLTLLSNSTGNISLPELIVCRQKRNVKRSLIMLKRVFRMLYQRWYMLYADILEPGFNTISFKMKCVSIYFNIRI